MSLEHTCLGIIADLQDRYVEDASDFLPWFKRKPHIIILSHPVQSYLNSGLFMNRESKGYTFITHTSVLNSSLDLSHVVRMMPPACQYSVKVQMKISPSAQEKLNCLMQAKHPWCHCFHAQTLPNFHLALM